MTTSELLSYYLWAGTALAFVLLGRNGIPKWWFLAFACCLLLWPVILIINLFLPKRLPNQRP